MTRGKEIRFFLKRINRKKLLIWVGIFLGIMLVSINMLKNKTIRKINLFRMLSMERIRRFDSGTWKLTVDGLVDIPLAISYQELLKLESEEQVTDFHRMEGWSEDDIKWKGVRLKILFDRAGLKPDAAFVTFHSESGMYLDSLSIEEALGPYIMLAYMLNDKPLSKEQGRPLRLVMPRIFGYKNVKWINRITLTSAQEAGHWERFGYKIDGKSYLKEYQK